MPKEKGATSIKGRYFWIALSAALVLLALVFVLSFQYVRCRERVTEMKGASEALLAKIETLQGGSLLRSSDTLRLKEEGLANPVQDLIADLLQHSELIPFKGVLGGTMGFYSKKDMHVLTSRWVLASFEDGHVGGRMLLEYRVSREGKISWKVLSAYLE